MVWLYGLKQIQNTRPALKFNVFLDILISLRRDINTHMKRFILSISDQLHKQLKLHAVQIEKPMSDIVNELIREYLEKFEKKSKK